MSPKSRALVGQASTHAGLRSRLRQRLVVDAVHAQRALLHHLLVLVDLARAVGTGPRAVLAADALVVVDQHDAVLGALVARAGRAHRHAGRVFAMQAGLREVHRLRVRKLADLERLHAVEERAGRILAVGTLVRQRPGLSRGVPFLAARHAGMAADADVEVDHQRELRHRDHSFCRPATKASHLRLRRAMPGSAGTGAAMCGHGPGPARSSAPAL